MDHIDFAAQPVPAHRLHEMNAALRAIQARYRERAASERQPAPGRDQPHDQKAIDTTWRRIREEQAEIRDLMAAWPRAEREALLAYLLPRGSRVVLAITDEWLDKLIIWRPARVLEAQRLKSRLMSRLSEHQKAMVADEGDGYWLRLAQSYQGTV